MWAAMHKKASRGITPFAHIPVLSPKALIDAVPADVEVPFLQADAQGYDFTHIARGAGAALRRARRVPAAVCQGSPRGFLYHLLAGVSNVYERGWVAHMAAAGYELVQEPQESAWGDATWERVGPLQGPGGVHCAGALVKRWSFAGSSTRRRT